MPKRIQRKRTKGWRMPENTLSVCRPGKWGNPFKVGAPHPEHGRPMSAQETADLFALHLFVYRHDGGSLDDYLYDIHTIEEIIDELKGKNLACFCKVGEPCHGDVLLELANKKCS